MRQQNKSLKADLNSALNDMKRCAPPHRSRTPRSLLSLSTTHNAASTSHAHSPLSAPPNPIRMKTRIQFDKERSMRGVPDSPLRCTVGPG
jgi:hypothetical protein